MSFKHFNDPLIIRRDLLTLTGILQGITADDIINEQEFRGLRQWIHQRKQYENKPPYNQVITALRAAIDDTILTSEEIEDIIWFCNHYTNGSQYSSHITQSITELTGIVSGLTLDNTINDTEIKYLDNWLEQNTHLTNTWPYDELYSLLAKSLQDQVISPSERVEILGFCKAIAAVHNTDTPIIPHILNTAYYQVDPQLTIPGASFCITGNSLRYKRSQIAAYITAAGGRVVQKVSNALNYLIVCEEKSTHWAFTCYGRKIEKAIAIRRAGTPLTIIHENDLYDNLPHIQ